MIRPTLAFLIGILATSPAEAAPSRRRLIALAGGVAAQLSSEYLFKDQIAAEQCNWCDPPDVDAALRDRLVWNDRNRARSLSNLSTYVTLPVISAGLLLIESRDAMPFLDDVMPCVEAVVYTSLVTQLVKWVVARQRPAVRYATEPAPANPEDNLAFFSGHSSFAFAVAVSAGTVAGRRGYALEPVIWASGLALAGTTAYLRVAADRHYVTDVAIGSAVGALAGYLMPRLTLPVAIVPAERGVAIAGSF